MLFSDRWRGPAASGAAEPQITVPPRAWGPVTGPTPGHLQKLAPPPKPAQLPCLREAGVLPRESGYHSYHHNYADLEIQS